MAPRADIMVAVPTSNTWTTCGCWRAERRDGRGHRLRVVALVDGRDLVLALRLVERVGDLLHLLAERSAHRVPHGDLGLGGGRRHQRKKQHDDGKRHDILLASGGGTPAVAGL